MHDREVADAITIDETSGVFTDTEATTLDGGDDDDTLRGGSGDEFMLGGAGQDNLLGNGGDDTIFGEDGPDTLVGGAGSDLLDGGTETDIVEGGPGDDSIAWRTGDGLFENVEGEEGEDTLQIFGDTLVDDIITIAPDNALIRIIRNPGNEQLLVGTVEQIAVDGLGGADTLTGADGLARCRSRSSAVPGTTP